MVLAPFPGSYPALGAALKVGAAEGPFDVPTALIRAVEVRQLYGFRTVLVSLLHRRHWSGAWGELVDADGLG